MTLLQISLTLALLLLIYMTVWWLIASLLKDMSLVDIAWGPAFVLVAWFMLYLSNTAAPTQLLATLLVTIWGIRLAMHIGSRKIGAPEDWRYARWRKQWKWVKTKSFFYVFLLQGFLVLLLSLPIILINMHAGPYFHWLAFVGLLVWLKGFMWEVLGDWQLTQHLRLKRNHGKLLTKGLRKYTRHPNYFGEATLWWGIGLMAASMGQWIALLSPALLTFLLIRVSGVPLIEERHAKKKGWDRYKKKTSMFIPWLPKA